MLGDRAFKIALLISLAGHGVILLQNPNFNFLNRIKEKLPEVNYVKPPEKPQERQDLKVESMLESLKKMNSDKRLPPLFIDKANISEKEKFAAGKLRDLERPTLNEPDIIAVKKRVTLPPLELDKINNPSYASYYQIVREKIKRAAYQNYMRSDTGEIYVSFIIADDGILKETRIMDEKSSSCAYLREIAVRSVEDASPFPTFPKELNYQRLSFNVVISFEIE